MKALATNALPVVCSVPRELDRPVEAAGVAELPDRAGPAEEASVPEDALLRRGAVERQDAALVQHDGLGAGQVAGCRRVQLKALQRQVADSRVDVAVPVQLLGAGCTAQQQVGPQIHRLRGTSGDGVREGQGGLAQHLETAAADRVGGTNGCLNAIELQTAAVGRSCWAECDLSVAPKDHVSGKSWGQRAGQGQRAAKIGAEGDVAAAEDQLRAKRDRRSASVVEGTLIQG